MVHIKTFFLYVITDGLTCIWNVCNRLQIEAKYFKLDLFTKPFDSVIINPFLSTTNV